jgi:hypothetical protein
MGVLSVQGSASAQKENCEAASHAAPTPSLVSVRCQQPPRSSYSRPSSSNAGPLHSFDVNLQTPAPKRFVRWGVLRRLIFPMCSAPEVPPSPGPSKDLYSRIFGGTSVCDCSATHSCSHAPYCSTLLPLPNPSPARAWARLRPLASSVHPAANRSSWLFTTSDGSHSIPPLSAGQPCEVPSKPLVLPTII